MGGGGSDDRSRGLTPPDFDRLARIARENLTRAASPGKKNIFLSFAGEDINEVNLLRGQAKNENSNLEFNDWSLQKPFDSKDAEYIKRGIRERIRQSSIVLVYVSPHTAQSKWVDWEIREALTLGKSVIAMYKGTTAPATVPDAIKEHRIRLVPWKQEEISKALGGDAK